MLRIAIVSVCAISIAAMSQTPAVASPWSGTEYKVTELKRTSNQIDANQVLASCSGAAGMTCSLTSQYTASRTVQVDLGAKVSIVTAQLSLGNATVKAYSSSCSWTLPTSKSQLIGYPLGEQVFYKITKNVYNTGKLTSSTTSGTLSAFKPYKGSLFCARIR